MLSLSGSYTIRQYCSHVIKSLPCPHRRWWTNIAWLCKEHIPFLLCFSYFSLHHGDHISWLKTPTYNILELLLAIEKEDLASCIADFDLPLTNVSHFGWCLRISSPILSALTFVLWSYAKNSYKSAKKFVFYLSKSYVYTMLMVTFKSIWVVNNGALLDDRLNPTACGKPKSTT